MPAFLERLGGGIYVLRAGPGAVRYGDPYTASGTVRPLRRVDRLLRLFGRGTCEVVGFTRRDTDKSSALKMDRAIRACLARVGYVRMTWCRIVNGRTRNVAG